VAALLPGWLLGWLAVPGRSRHLSSQAARADDGFTVERHPRPHSRPDLRKKPRTGRERAAFAAHLPQPHRPHAESPRSANPATAGDVPDGAWPTASRRPPCRDDRHAGRDCAIRGRWVQAGDEGKARPRLRHPAPVNDQGQMTCRSSPSWNAATMPRMFAFRPTSCVSTRKVPSVSPVGISSCAPEPVGPVVNGGEV
jgi:hypothetical protein